MHQRSAPGRALATFALLVGATACGIIPFPGGEQGDTEPSSVVGISTFVRPGTTIAAEVLGWGAVVEDAVAVRLTPEPGHVTVASAPTGVEGGAVRFALQVADEAVVGDIVTSAELIDADGAVVSPVPAPVTLHVMPAVDPARLDGDVLDVSGTAFDDGWLVVEADLAPGEHLAVIAYDPRERHLLTRLHLQGFGFADGLGLPLADAAEGVALAAVPLELGADDPYIAHLERETRFLETVDRLGLVPLHFQGPPMTRSDHPAQRRFAVPNFLEGGTSYVDTTLRAVSDHALVYVQDDHEPRPFEQPAAVAAAFDEVYAPTRAIWGEESDIDGNGRVILIVTPLTGFVSVVDTGDLYGGNAGEIIYGATASPGVLAHEFTHVITNHRKRVLQGARPPIWEMEGIAVTTEVLLDLVPAWPFDSLLQRPWNERAFRPYGFPALLVLAAGERAGGTGSGAWRAMHDTATVGAELIEEVTGVPFATHFGDVATALLLHGTAFEADPYRFVHLDLGSLERFGRPGERLPPLVYNALPDRARAFDLVNVRYFVSGPAAGGTASVVVREASARAHVRVLRLPSALPFEPDRTQSNWRVEGGAVISGPYPYLIAEGRVGDATDDLVFDLFYEGDGEVSFETWNREPWLRVEPERVMVLAGGPGVRFTLRFEPCTASDPWLRETELFLATDGASFAPGVARIRYLCAREPEAPTVHAFVAAASDVSPSSATELRWAVSGQGPLEVSITPDLGDVSDRSFAVVHPVATTAYELTARNLHGTATARLVIGACPDPLALVDVPDPALAADLRDALRLAPGAGLTCRALAGLEAYRAKITDIRDLDGLEAAVGLSELVLSGNQVASLEPLAGLSNLRLLRMSAMGVEDIGALAGLTNLYFLEAPANEIWDVTPLASLPRLRQLILRDNPLGSAAPLASMPSLRYLVLSGTGLDDLAFLNGLPDLIELDIWGNGFVDLDGIAAAVGLRTVLAGANQLESIDALLDLAGLAEGADVNVTYNCLDVSPGAPARAVVDTLLARGVSVQYERQRPDYACGDRLPVIRSFEATPTEIEAFDRVTLSWQVEGLWPLVVTLNGEGPLGQTGAWDEPVGETTTYTLRAENDYGAVEESVTVTVVP